MTIMFISQNRTDEYLVSLAYTGCIKKLNRFEIAFNFAKQLLVSKFLYTWLLWVLIM